jgi:hypothetical protein
VVQGTRDEGDVVEFTGVREVLMRFGDGNGDGEGEGEDGGEMDIRDYWNIDYRSSVVGVLW